MPRHAPFSIVTGLLVLAACGDPAPVEGTPVTVAYAAACDSAHHERVLTTEGYLHLFPRLLYCGPDGEGGQNCQVELLPAPDAPTEPEALAQTYPTVFIPEGIGPNEADARGYGITPAPVPVRAADSSGVGPGDRVRVTGRFHARPPITRLPSGPPLTCSFTVLHRIELVERAVPSWADRQAARADSLRALLDSMRVAHERRDSIAASAP